MADARARVRTPSGIWLLAHGSLLGEGANARSVVILEPAGTLELAPLVAHAYGLTERERVVTQLVAQGLDTAAMADRLKLSAWTIQDHLKTIFEKTGTGTRGELVARLFFDHYAPRLVGTDASVSGSSASIASAELGPGSPLRIKRRLLPPPPTRPETLMLALGVTTQPGAPTIRMSRRPTWMSFRQVAKPPNFHLGPAGRNGLNFLVQGNGRDQRSIIV